jgi:hypothetical protein
VEIRKPTLSPTALGNYLTCGRKGQYYHDPDIPGVTTLGLALGSAWHHGLETYGLARMYVGDTEVQALTPEHLTETMHAVCVGYLTEMVARDDMVWQEGEDIADAYAELWAMTVTWVTEPTNRWMGPGITIEEVEMHVRVDLGSEFHEFNGYMDGVYRTAEHGPVGVDYKSAGKRWAHNKDGHGKGDGDVRKLIQAPLYAEAYLRMTGEEMNWFVYDVMTKKGVFERVWVWVGPEVRALFVKRWVDTSNSIELHRAASMDLPHNPDNFLCSPQWCSYWEICDMGEGLKKRGTEHE